MASFSERLKRKRRPQIHGPGWIAVLVAVMVQAGCMVPPPDNTTSEDVIIFDSVTITMATENVGVWPENSMVFQLLEDGEPQSFSAWVDGDAAAETDGGIMSTTTVENDTFTLGPATQWITGGPFHLVFKIDNGGVSANIYFSSYFSFVPPAEP